MDSPALIYALRWFVRETFFQALASKLFWIFLLVTAMCTLFCLGISIEGGESLRPDGDYLYVPGTNELLAGPNPKPGRMNLLFGAFRVLLHRDAEAQVHMIQVVLGSWVAGAGGLLFLLVGTAAFLPEFLQPAAASVLLAKPLPRWLLLAGKFLGVVCFVALQALVFFVLTWLALGLRTGVWSTAYLAGIPLLLVQFATFYSFSVLLAVLTRSTLACVVGVTLFWILALALNFGRHSLVVLPELHPQAQLPSGLTAFLADLGYWLMPKPADMIMILERALDAGRDKATLASLPEMAAAWNRDAIDPLLTVLSSLLFTAVMLVLAGRQLQQTDY